MKLFFKSKKRSVIWLFSACVLAVGVLCSVYTSLIAADYSDATTQAYEAEIARLNSEAREWENQLAAIRGDQSRAAEYGEYLTKQISNVSDKIEVTQKYITVLSKDISGKEIEIKGEEEKISRTYRNFLERMRVSYEESMPSFLEILMDSKGLSDLLTRVERLNSMLEYDRRLKETYENAKAALVKTKAELDTDYAAQLKYSEELETDIAKLEDLITENDDYISSLNANEAYAYQEHLRREQEKEALTKELDEYILEQLRNTQAEYVGGQFAWPLNGATNYVVTCRHGWRTYQIYGYTTTDYHNGIDLRATVGTEVYAANDGEVVISTYHAAFGYYVLIDHGGGYSTLYAHNSQLLVSPGQKVTRGQLISLSGNTGYTSGPHLHFEIRVNNERVDPLSGNLLSTPTNMMIIE